MKTLQIFPALFLFSFSSAWAAAPTANATTALELLTGAAFLAMCIFFLRFLAGKDAKEEEAEDETPKVNEKILARVGKLEAVSGHTEAGTTLLEENGDTATYLHVTRVNRARQAEEKRQAQRQKSLFRFRVFFLLTLLGMLGFLLLQVI